MKEYELLIEKFHDYFTQDANACVSLGVDKNLDNLPDPSLESSKSIVDDGQKLLADIASFPRGVLDFEHILDLDLAALAVEFAVFKHSYTFNEKTELEQKPTAGDDISNGLFLMFVNDPRPAKERLDNITARLEKVPQYLEQLIKRLDTPVKRWVSMDIEKVEGLPDFFANLYSWAKDEKYPQLERLAKAKKEAEAALDQYIEQIKAMPTTEQFFIGKEQAKEFIRLRGIDKSIEELHKMAADFLQETAEELETLRVKLVDKYKVSSAMTLEELHDFLNQKYKVKLDPANSLSSVIVRYKKERDKITQYLLENDLFPIFKEQDMQIIQTPAFMAPSIPAGAMVSPPPFREGVKTSMVYLTLSEELLDEHTELSIPSMMIHEGIPGHHLQLATACTHPSVVRRHFDAMEHAEGWTTMLEDYMLDIGYMGDLVEEARFCAKRDISRIGARVAIDLYFMTGDKKYLDVGIDVELTSEDPFVNAGKLLQKVTGFVAGRVQAELNWYSQERSYPLCYLTGNKLVWELKENMAKAQKGKLEGLALDKVFHELYLKSGNMPLTFLRKVYEHEQML
ncbi:DUF885 family protein [Pelosinus sp. IPA-1]|uniref:DUF885 family protein n=1 Tax=Pelosinus sp. IPA-1 TaxID=3029569 RepID=UPI00243629CC|nr:DUF885 family protein [Pelosinus sp. IPA-1]GMA98304.1 hypothetical protein PIPA1_11040 [Pelosinus sp. IPA-1]